MDLFSPAELLELWLIEQSEINAQFEFWLTVSFAVVVASFVAGRKLQHKLRLFIAGLYFLAVATFASRWHYAAVEAAYFQSELTDLGVPIEIPWMTLAFRAPLMILGTAAVIVFLLSSKLYAGRNDD